MKISVTGASITVTEPEIIAAGSVNIYKAEFTFNAAWDGLTKVAFFLFRDELHPAVLDEENKCIIPWEAIQTDGWLQIACGGYLGVSKVLTSHYTEPQRIGEGADYESFKPEPSALAEVLMYMAASAQSAAQAAQSAEDARHQPVVGENGNWYTWDGENYVDTGDRAQGDAATIEVGTVTTGAPGTSAEVTNSGDANAAKFDFTIPRGDKGETGDRGPQGEIGPQGPQGDTGATGNGIASIQRTSGTGAPGTTDTYTITYTGGGTATFTVTHGTDGAATSKLTGYSKALTSEQLASTDSVLQAFGKLEKRIEDNASQISQLATLRNPRTIYGASWDKSSSPALTRIDAAVGLTAPQLEAMSIINDIIDVVDSYGNVFVRIPSFYIKKTVGTTDAVQISRTYKSGYYLPFCFWDFAKGRALPYVDIGKYTASSDDGIKLESKSGKYPLVNKTIVQCRTMAQANNTADIKGYQQFDIHAHDMLTALISVVYGTLNSQSIAQGWSAGNYASTHLSTVAENGVNRVIVANATAALYAVGQPIGLGTTQGGNQIFGARDITAIETYDPSNKAIVFDGAAVNVPLGAMLYNVAWKSGACDGIFTGSAGANNGKSPMVIFGVENLWGNAFQFVDGVNITDRQAWVCENADNYASNVFAAPYKQLSYVNGATNGYAVAAGYDPTNPFARFTVDVTGEGASTYYCDYYYQYAGVRIALFGGGLNDGSFAGLRYWHLSDNSSSATNVRISARLLKKPL